MHFVVAGPTTRRFDSPEISMRERGVRVDRRLEEASTPENPELPPGAAG